MWGRAEGKRLNIADMLIDFPTLHAVRFFFLLKNATFLNVGRLCKSSFVSAAQRAKYNQS